jgi:hypothetical protein
MNSKIVKSEMIILIKREKFNVFDANIIMD